MIFQTYPQRLNAVDKSCSPLPSYPTQVLMKKDQTLSGGLLSQGKTGLLHLDGLCCSLPKGHQESSAIHTPT